MSDLHSRLLAHVQVDGPLYHLAAADITFEEYVNSLEAVVRAVVELHAPEQHYAVGQDNKRRPTWLWCRRCRQKSPCEELQVIAEQLGVPIEERTEKEGG